MIYQLRVPPVDGVEEVRVLQWHKSEGEVIPSGQLVVELETEKAIIEVRSPCVCVLRKIVVGQGSWALIGPPVAWFSDAADETLNTDQAEDLAAHWELT